ncbi:MAG: hypothetical protein RSD49_08010 [Hafnia sp.]
MQNSTSTNSKPKLFMLMVAVFIICFVIFYSETYKFAYVVKPEMWLQKNPVIGAELKKMMTDAEKINSHLQLENLQHIQSIIIIAEPEDEGRSLSMRPKKNVRAIAVLNDGSIKFVTYAHNSFYNTIAINTLVLRRNQDKPETWDVYTDGSEFNVMPNRRNLYGIIKSAAIAVKMASNDYRAKISWQNPSRN